MSKSNREIMSPMSETAEDRETSSIVLPENLVEVFGGSIEASLNELLSRHVETSVALKNTIAAQHALQETMDRAVILMQDPQRSQEDAVKELMGLLSLQEQLKSEREELERAYAEQEKDYANINSEMKRLAKEHPELFIMGSEPAAA